MRRPDRTDSPLPRRLTALALAAAVWLGAGCAPLAAPNQGDPPSAEAVFDAGFEDLSERYIEDVALESLALAGIGGLRTVEPGLGVARSGSTLRLRLGDTLLQEFRAPAAEDVSGWASVTARMYAAARHAAPALAEADPDELYKAVFDGVLAPLDRYSRYATPEAARRHRASRNGFGGLGITIDQEDGVTVITRVHEDTPASRAGLKVDDRIIRVDGDPVKGMPLPAMVDRLRGPVKTTVRLTVRRPGRQATLPITVTRDHITIPTVYARAEDEFLEIRINGFNRETAHALRRALEAAEREHGGPFAGVILDLRGNPGGLLDQAVAVADLFLTRGRIVSTSGRHPDSHQAFYAGPEEIAHGVPLAVLINGRSASAAEIVAVALRDSGRAVIIGSTSYGKGTVQTILPLPNRGEIVLTWARIVAPSGQTLHRKGIVPAICTSGGEEEQPRALLDALKAASARGIPVPADALRPQAGQPHYSEAAVADCPASPAESAADREAARLVLGSREVYRQAVAQAPPSIATR